MGRGQGIHMYWIRKAGMWVGLLLDSISYPPLRPVVQVPQKAWQGFSRRAGPAFVGISDLQIVRVIVAVGRG